MTWLPRGAALLALALVVGACSRETRAQEPYAREVSEAIPVIERYTGLKFKQPPRVATRTKAQIHEFVDREFSAEHSRQDIAGQQILLRRLGLIPDTLDLGKLLVTLYSEQIAGLYDPKTKTLYVVDRAAPEDQLAFVIQHELVHALQDQYMSLDSIQNIRGDDDRVLAAQSVIEGQATLVPLQAMLGPGASLPGGWDRVRQAIRDNRNMMPEFAAAPEVLQETMLFPYLNGAEFVRQFDAHEPGKSPLGPNLPTSTEQILHDTLYFRSPRDRPLYVELPPITGVQSLYENDLGEFETRLFLFAHLQDQSKSVQSAAGWSGDRYAVFTTPRGDGLAWVSVWDSAIDAGEFASALSDVIDRRYTATVRTTSQGKVFEAKGRTMQITGGDIAGHAAVLYVDVPSGTRTDLIDLRKVTLR